MSHYISCIAGVFFTTSATWEALILTENLLDAGSVQGAVEGTEPGASRDNAVNQLVLTRTETQELAIVRCHCRELERRGMKAHCGPGSEAP